MAQNRSGVPFAGNIADAQSEANVDNSGTPRGPNLTDLGHTGPKSGDEALTTSEQHREMSQHELRGHEGIDDQIEKGA